MFEKMLFLDEDMKGSNTEQNKDNDMLKAQEEIQRLIDEERLKIKDMRSKQQQV